MINVAKAAADYCIDDKLLLTLLELTNITPLNELIYIEESQIQAAVALSKDLINYPNVSQFLEENSKAYGDVAEKSLIKTLQLGKALSRHYDGHDIIRDNKIELKVTRPLVTRNTTLPRSFAQRALSFDYNNPSRGGGTYQHVKPKTFDYLIGATIYIDCTVLHMIDSDGINSSTDEAYYNPLKIRLREQQFDQKTEGYLLPNELPIVGIIQGVSFDDMNVSICDLMEAYNNKEVVYNTNGVKYSQLNELIAW